MECSFSSLCYNPRKNWSTQSYSSASEISSCEAAAFCISLKDLALGHESLEHSLSAFSKVGRDTVTSGWMWVAVRLKAEQECDTFIWLQDMINSSHSRPGCCSCCPSFMFSFTSNIYSGLLNPLNGYGHSWTPTPTHTELNGCVLIECNTVLLTAELLSKLGWLCFSILQDCCD